jgi:Flp pilus assembly protein TadG
MLKNRLSWGQFRKGDGAALVEFAIACSVLLMMVLGIIEFGFLWYQKQVITNASREAARYGVTYQTTSSGSRLAPQSITSPYTISQVVDNYCNGRLPSTPAKCWSTTVTDDPLNTGGYTAGTKGKPIVVTVTCANKMDVLSGFIPSLKNISFTAKTIMNCE